MSGYESPTPEQESDPDGAMGAGATADAPDLEATEGGDATGGGPMGDQDAMGSDEGLTVDEGAGLPSGEAIPRQDETGPDGPQGTPLP